MGYRLYRMIRDGAPADWTPPMIQVAQAIADDAHDPSPGDWSAYADGGRMPWSARPVEGHWTERGEWRDGLGEWTGMASRTIRRALADLAAAGYEMRQVISKDKHGGPVYAHKGQAVRFQVPYLPPRPAPAKVAKSGDLSTRDEVPKVAASGDLTEPKAAKSGDLSGQRPPKSGDLSDPKVAKSGDPLPSTDLVPPEDQSPRGDTPRTPRPGGEHNPLPAGGAPTDPDPVTEGEDSVARSLAAMPGADPLFDAEPDPGAALAVRAAAPPPDPDPPATPKRGTRVPAGLPDQLRADAAFCEWFRRECPDVDGGYELAQFMDYWTAKTGKDATKLDWKRTVQKWMRKAQHDAAQPGRRREGGVEMGLRLLAERQARAAGGA